MNDEELAEGMYLAFCRATENRRKRLELGDPDFDKLERRRRGAWIAAAAEARALLRCDPLPAALEVHRIVKGASA